MKIKKYIPTRRIGNVFNQLVFPFCIAIYTLIPFYTEVGIAYYGFLVFVYSVFMYCLIMSFTPMGWISRRNNWLTNDPNNPIKKEKIEKYSILWFKDVKNGVACYYYPSDKKFVLSHIMFLNPARYEKEYGERKYQAQVRTDRISIPHYTAISDCDNCFSFNVGVIIDKQSATKANICKIRDEIMELAKDDYDQHIFVRFSFDEDTLYMEIHQLEHIKSVLVNKDNEKEYYIPEEYEKNNISISDRFYNILNTISIKNYLGSLMPKDIITEEEFKKVYGLGIV